MELSQYLQSKIRCIYIHLKQACFVVGLFRPALISRVVEYRLNRFDEPVFMAELKLMLLLIKFVVLHRLRCCVKTSSWLSVMEFSCTHCRDLEYARWLRGGCNHKAWQAMVLRGKCLTFIEYFSLHLHDSMHY